MIKLCKIALSPVIFFIALYTALRKLFVNRTYYISGTGINRLTGERMFFKVTVTSPEGYIPIKVIENKVTEELDLKTCIVLHFAQVARDSISYMEDSSINLTIYKENGKESL